MSIPERLRLLCPHTETADIEGQTFTFYTCSFGVVARLAPVIARLMSKFAVLMGNGQQDQGYVSEDYVDENGMVISKTTTEAITAELAETRARQREEAVQVAVETVLADHNRLAVARMISDSLRDDFPRGKDKPKDDELRAWMDDLDLPVFFQFLMGMLKANKRVFGDLGKGLGPALQKQVDDALKRAGAASQDDESEQSSTAG